MFHHLQAPNPKIQAPEKLQLSNSKSQVTRAATSQGRFDYDPPACRKRGLEIWSLVFLWILDLGIWSLTLP
jgi:hypothetical protein